jgi:uncharacterized damage-inducible protein DinB
MPHPLVTQLKFTRHEFVRCFRDLPEEDAARRLLPSNALSWIIGHLASQEQTLWLHRAQGKSLYPTLDQRVGHGNPPTTPPISEMWSMWREIIQAANPYLETLRAQDLETCFVVDGSPMGEDIGTLLYRNIYHYWFHLGEAHALRQQMGHKNLPEYVGRIPKTPFTAHP